MVCLYCDLDKPSTAFAKNRRKCKTCRNEQQKEWNNKYTRTHKEQRRIYYRQWYATNGRNRAVDYSEAIKDWQVKNPEKVKARLAVNRAVKNGELTKSDVCDKCGRKVRLNGHHYDYNKQLDVAWLCHSCHKLEHSLTKLEQSRTISP